MTLQEKIEQAAAKFDRDAAHEGAKKLVKMIRQSGTPDIGAQALAAIGPLMNARMFRPAMRIADAAFESGATDDRLRVKYVQALIDDGRIHAALPLLDQILANAAPGSPAHDEARGLRGRANKQLYVNGGGRAEQRQEYLDRAFFAYYEAWREKPADHAWHGINAAALLALAQRRGAKAPAIEPFVDRIAADLQTRIDAGNANHWTYATAGEAAVAAGKFDDAKKWYARFASHPKVNAFALGSALRQLREVWDLSDDRYPGSELLPLLRSELLGRSGGEVALAPASVRGELQRASNAGLQKTFGLEGAREFPWYRTGLQRCLPVCRIGTLTGKPWGTGFMVRGGDLRKDLGDERCILTNDHVVSLTHAKALRPPDAHFRFHAIDESKQYAVREIIASSTPHDATLLRVDQELPDCDPYPIAAGELARDADPPCRIFVIGHPRGGALAISLYDNLLLDYDKTYLHYRSPTEPGSSGSPVFNDEWELVALHHAGLEKMRKLDGSGETYRANEGVLISAIREAFA